MQLSNINLFKINSLNPSYKSKFSTNPFKFINFKGNLKEDKVELSTSAERSDIEAKKAAAQKKVENKTRTFKKTIITNQKIIEELKATRNVLENLLKDEKIRAEIKKISELNLDSPDDEKLDKAINSIVKQVCANRQNYGTFQSNLKDIILALQKNNWDFDDKNIFSAIEEKIEKLQEYINHISSFYVEPYERKLEIYFKELEAGSIYADCFEPLTDEKTIHKNLKEKNIQDRLTVSELLSDCGTNTHKMTEAESIQKTLKDEGLIKYKTIGEAQIVDLDDKTTKKTMEFLSEKQGKLKTPSRLQKELGLTSSAFSSVHFNFVDFKTKKPIHLIDLTDEASVKSLEKLNRFICKKSKYFWDGNTSKKPILAPASHLERLGYGTVPMLRKMVQDGYLKGRVDIVDTSEGKKYRTQIETTDIYNYKKLINLKEKNPALITFEALAKELGITKAELMQSIMADEAEIMPQCLFCYDREHKFINKTTPKNKEFIQKKLFEKELSAQLKENERKQKELERIKNKDIHSKMLSMRMKLVWYFCPDTRENASKMAENNGYLCELLAKDREKEELTQKEQIIVNSYRKQVWEKSGTQELRAAFKKADEVLEKYYKYGIDSIEDEQIKEKA